MSLSLDEPNEKWGTGIAGFEEDLPYGKNYKIELLLELPSHPLEERFAIEQFSTWEFPLSPMSLPRRAASYQVASSASYDGGGHGDHIFG